MPKCQSLETRFWQLVEMIPFHTCWEWIGAQTRFGYGQFRSNGIVRGAHRVSWEIHNGPIPGGLWVLHHCDNPSCVRPDHLFIGTRTDNMRDAFRKGRGNVAPAVAAHVFNRRALQECKRGHPLNTQNTYTDASGHRHCRSCYRIRDRLRSRNRRLSVEHAA